jgi:phenylpropionate dioxygenase-like ring-hydroxylating dioxygenase large terminal subunit
VIRGVLRRVPPPLTAAPPPGLARGWYVAATSETVKAGLVPVVVAGRELVVWRDGSGRPVVMDRYCPHQGASLALGRVVDDTVRCPFHHWRFAADGQCVMAPDTRRVPPGVRAGNVPAHEAQGLVWAWIGSEQVEYPPPAFPDPRQHRRTHRSYRFRFTTEAPPRRVLENGFDTSHFPVVHGLVSPTPLELEWMPCGRPDTVAARLVVSDLDVPAPLNRWIRMGELALRLVSSPSYQTLTFDIDGRPLARELLAVTPVAPGQTVMHGWTTIARSSDLWGSAAAFWGYRLQHWQGTVADLRIYRQSLDTDGSINTSLDEGVLRFRQFYRRWVGDSNDD